MEAHQTKVDWVQGVWCDRWVVRAVARTPFTLLKMFIYLLNRCLRWFRGDNRERNQLGSQRFQRRHHLPSWLVCAGSKVLWSNATLSGHLTPDDSKRRLVCANVWQTLKSYFPETREFTSESDVCRYCLVRLMNWKLIICLIHDLMSISRPITWSCNRSKLFTKRWLTNKRPFCLICQPKGIDWSGMTSRPMKSITHSAENF